MYRSQILRGFFYLIGNPRPFSGWIGIGDNVFEWSNMSYMYADSIKMKPSVVVWYIEGNTIISHEE